MARNRIRRAGAALLTALALAGCTTNPATGGRQFTLISEGQEIRMGSDYDREIVASLGLYPDSALQQYVQDLGSRLAATSERPDLPWTFRVLDDPVVNAFALPGGYIYVTRGILAHLNSEAELAAVLGHEIGHVTARHSVSRISTQQLAQVGLAIGVALKPELEDYAGLASAGLSVLFLKHGRDDERQADDLGLRYMRRGAYDPREMGGVFDMLARVSAAHGGGRIPEWLSTHPNPENRRGRIEQQVAALNEDFAGARVERSAYLRRLDGMVYGEDPREGFFRGSEFLHPELAFRFRFPDRWTTSNQKQAVLAVSPGEDAIIQLTLAEASSPDLAARAFLGRPGITAGRADRGAINGLDAASAEFAATTERGVLRGAVAFVAHGGAVYRLLAYAPDARWPAYDGESLRALRSFGRLTDASALAVQPQRLEIVTLDRSMTLEELARARPGAASIETLALINHAAPSTFYIAGDVVKRVAGQPAT